MVFEKGVIEGHRNAIHALRQYHLQRITSSDCFERFCCTSSWRTRAHLEELKFASYFVHLFIIQQQQVLNCLYRNKTKQLRWRNYKVED